MVVLERGEIPNQVWNDIYLLFFCVPLLSFFFLICQAQFVGL